MSEFEEEHQAEQRREPGAPAGGDQPGVSWVPGASLGQQPAVPEEAQPPSTASYPAVPATPGGAAPGWGPGPGAPGAGWGWPQWPAAGSGAGGPGDPGGPGPYQSGGQWGPWGPWGPPPGGYWSPPPPPPPLSPRARRVRAITGTVVAAVLAAAVGVVVGRAAFSTTSPTTNANATGPSNVFSGGQPSGPANVSAIAAKIDPGLVDINTIIGYNTGLQGAGTGMVVSPTGEVITNNHVIDQATQIKVTDLGNGQTYNAAVVGYDHNGDIAVLQLQGASGLTTVPFGNSSSMSVGDPVVAIGNAGGLGGTPSVAPGTITATNQSITASDQADGTSEQLSGLLETNADIQPGDSGGPLVNAKGQVIGMDTAASSGFSLGGNSTQGYSIPINTVSTVAKQIESGKPAPAIHLGATGFIGVSVAPSVLACEQANGGGGAGGGGLGGGAGGGGFGFGGNSSAANGAVVCAVIPGTPASRSGLAAYDVITAVDGSPVTSPSDLTNKLIAYHPGDKVQLTYTDTSGASHTLSLTLAAGPPQ